MSWFLFKNIPYNEISIINNNDKNVNDIEHVEELIKSSCR